MAKEIKWTNPECPRHKERGVLGAMCICPGSPFANMSPEQAERMSQTSDNTWQDKTGWPLPIAEGIGYDKGNYYARYLRHLEDAKRQRLAKFEAYRNVKAAWESHDGMSYGFYMRHFQSHLAAQQSHRECAIIELANARIAGQVPPEHDEQAAARERIAQVRKATYKHDEDNSTTTEPT